MSRRMLCIIIALIPVCSTPNEPCDISQIVSADSLMMTASCSGRSLTEVPSLNKESSRHVVRLDVSDNLITSLENDSFDGFDNVEFIDLKNHKIEAIEKNAFSNLKHLAYVYLSGNNLAAIGRDLFTNCSRILKLSLSHNNFSHVSNEYPFLTSLTLNSLDLSFCEIGELPVKFFSELPNLMHIDLSNNNLTSLNPLTFAGLRRLKSVILRENPWMCTCELNATIMMFHKRQIKFNPVEIKCFMGHKKISINAVIPEEPCEMEVAYVPTPTETLSTPSYSKKNLVTQNSHLAKEETSNNEDKIATTITVPEKGNYKKEIDSLVQNLSKQWDILFDMRKEINKLKAYDKYAERQHDLIAIAFVCVIAVNLILVGCVIVLWKIKNKNNQPVATSFQGKGDSEETNVMIEKTSHSI